MAPGSSAASSAASVAGANFGSRRDGARSRPTSAPTVRPRHSERKPQRRDRRRLAVRDRRVAIRRQVGAAEDLAGAHHPGRRRPAPPPQRPASGRSPPTRAHARRRRRPEPASRPPGASRPRAATIASRHPLGIEAGVDRANHLGEDVRPRQPAPQRRLKRPEPARPDPVRICRHGSSGATDDGRETADQSRSIDSASHLEWRILLSASSCKY